MVPAELWQRLFDGPSNNLNRSSRTPFNHILAVLRFACSPCGPLLFAQFGFPSGTLYLNQHPLVWNCDCVFEFAVTHIDRFPIKYRIAQQMKEVRDADFIQRFVALLLLGAEPRPENAQGLALSYERQQRLAFVRVGLPRREFVMPRGF